MSNSTTSTAGGKAVSATSQGSTAVKPAWIGALEQAGLVTTEVLESAWNESRRQPRQAGEWLVEHGCVTQRDLAAIQAECFELAFVEPRDFRINLDNRLLVPEEWIRTHELFPLFVIDRIITLAVTWPLDLPLLDQIRLHTGYEVDQVLTNHRDLNHLIEWAFGGFTDHQATKSAATIAWEEILKDVTDAPAVKLVNVLLDQAAGSKASDVHIDGEEHAMRIRFRIDGVLREVPAPPKELLPAVVSRIKVIAHMDIAETRKPQDGHFKLAIDGKELDVRVSTLPSADGEAVVLRLLHSGGHLLTLEELGMDERTQNTFDRLIHLPHGMLLVTGPTGSGKTTTLYSALTRIDRVRQSIVTLEEPVEIRLPQIRQVGVTPKAGLTFQSGLRSILRQDPDVIMLGEIRDLETAEIALQAALTGHLLLSTLHTNSAAAAPVRLLDMGIANFLVSSALVGILAQRLCRRLCPHCARPVESRARALAALPQSAATLLEDCELMQAGGCKRCANTGYSGRAGIYELLVITDEMRRAIPAGANERELVALARKDGMRLLQEDGIDKVGQGLTTIEELMRVAGQLDVGDLEPLPSQYRTAELARGQAEVPEIGRADFSVGAYEHLLRRWLQPREQCCGVED